MDYFVEVEKSVRRSQPALYALAALFGVLGLGLVSSGLWPHLSAVALFGLVLFAIATVPFRFAWRNRDPRNAPLLKLLRERPHEIAWAYENQVTTKVYGTAVARAFHIMIRTVDGKIHVFTVRAGEPATFLAWLSRLAPRATYGYSKEREKAFRANPRSFLRAG